MKGWRVLAARLAGAFRRGDARLDSEIQAHLDLLTEEHQRRGLSPDAARQAARRDFGGVEQVKEAYRDQHRVRTLETLAQDVRYGLRALMKAPGFALVAVLTLALGILANTTIVSAVNAVLFRPLPIEKPEEIVAIFQGGLRGGPAHLGGFSFRTYADMRDANAVLSALVATKIASVSLVAGGRPLVKGQPAALVQGEIVSGNYFQMLGVGAARGRTLTPDDDRAPNAHPVVVISERLRRRLLEADPEPVGRVIHLNGNPFTVIGVAPVSFNGSEFAVQMDFWAPLMMQGQLGADPDWWREGRATEMVVLCITSGPGGPPVCGPERAVGDLRLLGRLKPGVAPEVAQEQLTALLGRLPNRTGGSTEPTRLEVVPELEARHRAFFQQVRRVSVIAFVASALVWLVACGNVANLALARATVRSREMAIRLALGAGRWRVGRQLLTETMLLALLAGGLAVLLTFWTTSLLSAARPANLQLPLAFDFRPDLRVLGWALGLSMVTGVVFGIGPTWRIARTDLVPALKPGESGSANGARRLTLRNALVVAQLSMSVVVLDAGVLLARSLRNLQESFDPGFRTEALLSMRFEAGTLGYKPPRVAAFYRDLLEQVRTLPRAESFALVSSPPFGNQGSESVFVVAEGGPVPRTEADAETELNAVSPGYFHTMGIPVVAGREFDERDDSKATPVAILDGAGARRLFGTVRQAIGRRVRADDSESAPSLEVVGVIADNQVAGFPVMPRLFRPVLQGRRGPNLTLVVRAASAGDLRAVATNVQEKVQQLDPLMPVSALRLGEEHADPELGAMRLGTQLAMALGILALAMAALGLYGVIAYAVSVRTREIGIRLALGARAASVQTLVLRQGLVLTLAGLAIGLAGTVMLTPVLGHFLIGVRVTDPATFTGVSVALAVIALLASYLPTRRATRIDPTVALKCE